MRKFAGARPFAPRISGAPSHRAPGGVLAAVLATLVAAVAVVAVVAAGAPAPYAGAATIVAGGPNAPRAWVLVDNQSGTVLQASDPHEALYPASTAKLMTALVAVEKLQLNGTVLVSDTAAGKPAMKIGMKAGEQWQISDALHSLLMVSANDAAVALAEAASGSLDRFPKDAGALARRLGMHDSTWNDPAGLDDEFANGGGTRASAFDLAVAARNVLTVPALAEIAARREFRFTGPDGHGHVLRNHDRLLTRYDGAIGLKTGYTKKAGHTLVAAARRGDRTMIAVVLGADDPYTAAITLLDAGFATPVDAPGTGEHLPAAKVAPAGSPSSGAGLARPTFLPTTKQAVKSAKKAVTQPGHTGGGRHWGRTLFFVGLLAAFFGRRQQIKRRRARRVARRPNAGARREAPARQPLMPALEVDEPIAEPVLKSPVITRPVRPVPLIDLSDLPDFDFPPFADELAARRRHRRDDDIPREARNR